MTRSWHRVALAALVAAVLAGAWASDVAAQAKQPEDEQESDTEAKAVPAKKKKQDPAEAQRAVDGATKLLHAGKTEQAVQSLTGILNAGNMPPSVMAKALYARGVAYRQQSKPAQAISDLTSALWLKGGLNETDRTEALKQRSGAYSDAGLTEAGEPLSVAAKERPSAPGKGWGAVTNEPSPSPTSQAPAGGGWFQNIFGASASPAKGPEPQRPPSSPKETASIEKPAPPQPASGRAPSVSTAWASSTKIDRSAPEPAAPVSRAAPPPAAAKPAGKYRVQLATVRTRDEAKALAAKAQREHAAVLASREAEIDQAVLGNMGSFYRLRFGPYATVQETQAVCAKLKGSGFDCMSVTQ